jgi:hypothetical protein
MKTPMQELIDQMWEIAKYGDSYEVAPCIEAAEAMLEKEKEVMCGIYDDALARVDRNYIGGEGEQYFEETFKTKEK